MIDVRRRAVTMAAFPPSLSNLKETLMKRTLLPFLLAGSLLVGADAGEKDGGTREPPPGFVSLFNGKDLKSWKNPDKQPEWTIEGGLIHYTGKGGKNLATAKNYKDFEMCAYCKITKGSTTGFHLP